MIYTVILNCAKIMHITNVDNLMIRPHLTMALFYKTIMNGFVSKLLSNNVLEAKNVLAEKLKELISKRNQSAKAEIVCLQKCLMNLAEVNVEIENGLKATVIKMFRTKISDSYSLYKDVKNYLRYLVLQFVVEKW
jgi:hypothetical protein